MGVQRTTVGESTVLLMSGDFVGGDETSELERAIAAEEAAGNTHLVLDLSECSAMNSTAFGLLVAAYGRFKGRGAQLKLSNVPKKIDDLLRMTGTARLF